MIADLVRYAFLTAVGVLYLALCAVAVTVACSRKDGVGYQLVGAGLGFVLLLFGFMVIQGTP